MPTPLCGHEAVRALTDRAVAAPAGAYGFFGPEHIGKRGVAEAFARRLAGHPEPLALEAHPDIALLDAAAEGGIEAVRTFLERMHHTAARGGRRVFLIDHAEALNAAGFNALLKDVEEPRPGTVFLFVSSQPEALPATLRSRLVPLALREVPIEALAAWAGDLELPPAWLAEACGRPGLLLRRHEDGEWWDGLVRHARQVASAYGHPSPGALVAALDDWQRSVDARTHSEQDWRLLLLLLSRQATGLLAAEAGDAPSFARALVTAWRSLGGAIPPRIAFEWHRLGRAGSASPERVRAIRDWSA